MEQDMVRDLQKEKTRKEQLMTTDNTVNTTRSLRSD